MFQTWLTSMKQRGLALLQRVQQWLKAKTKPASASLMLDMATDLLRSKSELVLENALLRQQLIVLSRSVKRPKVSRADRWLLVLLSSKLKHWKQAVLIIQPDTVLRWQRDLFKWFWRRKSPHTGGKAPLSAAVIALIQQMARENRLWGVKRIRGELIKLGLHVSKSSIQKYILRIHPLRPSTQTWTTFVHNHADAIWACDFIQVTDLFFRSLFVFVLIELGSRRVVHVGVNRQPSDAWVAQQLREATPFGQGPQYLICDNDDKYGHRFDMIAQGANIKVMTTPLEAPRANAYCERFIGSVRRECLDHLLLFGEGHLRRIMQAYVTYFNTLRPHQGLDQQIPIPSPLICAPSTGRRVISRPILGGLHHAYAWAA